MRLSTRPLWHPIVGSLRVLALLFLAAAPLGAQAEQRIALVVGNGGYQSIAALDNPISDAALIAETLTSAGFDVTLLTDTDWQEMSRGIAQFGRDLRDAGPEATGLFYYAGHGVQSFGTNYLLPVDAELVDAADLSLAAVPAEAVLRQMFSARNKTNIVILDACRDNPFERIPDLNDNGLAEMKAPTGTFLSYSTGPGQVALDGLEGNSPFTRALAANIPTPGLAVEQLFKRVRNQVIDETSGVQIPWDASSLTADFTFVNAPQMTQEEIELQQLWKSVKASQDPVQVLLFLRAHPDSVFTEEARALISALMADVAGSGDAPDTAAVAQPEPVQPEASEREMIGKAQQSGAAEDYEAYLKAYPDGVYAELAEFELGVIAERAAAATAPAAAPQEPETPAAAAGPSDALPATVAFDAPLGAGGPGIEERSLAELILGAPLFAPIDGLPDEVWKGKSCSNCHQWTREALCTQAETYLADSATRSLAKRHPYGGVFKGSMRVWASDGCQ